jgi:Mg-chelatase subunit ChlD
MKLLVHLAFGVALLGCNEAVVDSPAPRGSGGGPAAGAGGGAQGPGVVISGADAGAEVASPSSSPATCAEDVHRAESVPVDLLLLVDTSESMNDVAGMRSKWSLVRDALIGFVRDPKSTGLGVGLQFFPRPKECATDADCPGRGGACQRPPVCAGATPPAAGVMPPACPGVCAGIESCAAASYQALALPIAPLPGGATSIASRLEAVSPVGGTPTGAAVAGVLAQARAHQTANPDHRVALVVATDGVPSACEPMDGPGIAALIRAARAASPSIGTYVIGVFTQEEAAMAAGLLQQLATAGGSDAAFVLDASADLGQKFQQALDRIRGAALPCEFTIPPPSAGAIDFAKVNVRHQGGAAPAMDLPYVATADRCDPARGGWYYDVLPSMGRPGRVLICPASCSRFKADAAANVSLVFGCATRVIE